MHVCVKMYLIETESKNRAQLTFIIWLVIAVGPTSKLIPPKTKVTAPATINPSAILALLRVMIVSICSDTSEMLGSVTQKLTWDYSAGSERGCSTSLFLYFPQTPPLLSFRGNSLFL